MFRAQQNVFDDLVAKATDENLTSENWEYILEVCDKVNAEPSGGKDVVASMIKRLAHRNANVQLYTLEVANALSQNCGDKVHRELSSRAFTEALIRLANDRNTHHQVKAKILEVMGAWSEMFRSNPELGIMEQAYAKLKNQNPNLHPPSKPTKRQITDLDRQKEEEELQMALALSIKDKATPPTSRKNTVEGSSAAVSQPAPTQPVSSGTTAATISRVRALYDFQPSEPGELQFKKGDIIAVLESVFKDWWKGSLRGQTGIFPLNYVEKLSDPTQEELQEEAQMEAEVFAEIKNVERLLTLLSTSSVEHNVRENDEITALYQKTLAIRPKLIELIKKYSQRKDDFTQLNEKFIKARRDYDALLEASMSQPPPQAYGRPGQPQYGYAGPSYPAQGGVPPQDYPGRYYTPNPQDSRTPQPQSPLQSGPAPYYAIQGQVNPQLQQQRPQYPQDPRIPASQQNMPPPQADPYNRRPQSTYDNPQAGGQPPQADPYNRRPQSTYDNPVEIGTYTSPTEVRTQTQAQTQTQAYPPQFQPQAQGHTPGSEYSPSVYSPEDTAQQPLHQQQQQQQQQQPPPPQQTQATQQPYPSGPPPAQASHAPPQAPSPGLQQGPHPILNSGPPRQNYQAYHPSQAQQHGYVAGAAAASNPNDFYR